MDRILILTNSHAYEEGLSGGERIAIELYRRWSKKCEVYVYTSNFGKYTWEKCGIDTGLNFYFCSNIKKNKKILLSYIDLALSYLKRIFDILFNKSFMGKIKSEVLLYSASDFWPDSIPSFIAKIINPKIKWIAGFYLLAPSPWQKDSPYKQQRWIIGFFYWLTQQPILWIIKKYADMVFVTSEPDTERFVTRIRDRNRVVVIKGGVDIKKSDEYLKSGNAIPVNERRFDACFVGRFHYQKGAVELIDIWKLVCVKKPNAVLAIIGIGPLENEVRNKILKLNLQNNIKLLGFVDGEEKYIIFKESKIIVHPAIYDSGGMAAAEAMAWGLPGVSFDLESLKTYYSRGMLKTPCYDLNKFSDNILRLLTDEPFYNQIREDAVSWAREWDWDKRAEDILRNIRSELSDG